MSSGDDRMTATLRVPEMDLYAIFERMSDGVMIVSAAGSVIYRNASMSSLPDFLQNHVLDHNGKVNGSGGHDQCWEPAADNSLEGWTVSCHPVGSNTAYIFRQDCQLVERIERLREEFSRQVVDGVTPSLAAMQVLRKFVTSRWVAIGTKDPEVGAVTFDVAFDGDKIRSGIIPDIAPDDDMDFCSSIITTSAISKCFARHELAEELGIRHLVGVSLKDMQKECVGFALLADDHEPGNVHETVTLLREVRALYGPFFQADNAQLEARVAVAEANTDALTGKGNRRACEAYLQECLDDMAFETKDSPVLAMFDPNAMRNAIVMLVDVDGFKRINDSLGHEEGDRALRLVAQHLSEIDPDSRVFRLGGDEFVQIFPRAGALEAEDLRTKINEVEQSLAEKGFESFGLSMGVVHFFEGDGSMSSLTTLADARMYHDKRLRSVSFIELDI